MTIEANAITNLLNFGFKRMEFMINNFNYSNICYQWAFSFSIVDFNNLVCFDN